MDRLSRLPDRALRLTRSPIRLRLTFRRTKALLPRSVYGGLGRCALLPPELPQAAIALQVRAREPRACSRHSPLTRTTNGDAICPRNSLRTSTVRNP